MLLPALAVWDAGEFAARIAFVSSFDVAIVGGGLIGASIAFELSAEKLRVVILDSQKPCRWSR
jgi:glycerol-3-phosphate dehydrogenase